MMTETMMDHFTHLTDRSSPEVGQSVQVPKDGRYLSVAVVIASTSRPELLDQIYGLMQGQTCRPDLLVFSVVNESDVGDKIRNEPSAEILYGPKGLCAQRNRALDRLGNTYDLIVFYDDDFIPASNSIARIKKFFATHQSVIGATGNVIKDGIGGAGVSFDEAMRHLAEHERKNFDHNYIVASLEGLYGCNMAYRASAIGTSRFDERLKLYGWQEDVDFASSLSSRGRIVKTFAFSGVHQGVKFGRTCGIKLGYSQIINPIYLVKKGTMPKSFALRLIFGNLISNHVKSLRSESWIDRPGRMRGNWIALFDLLKGRIRPERIESL